MNLIDKLQGLFSATPPAQQTVAPRPAAETYAELATASYGEGRAPEGFAEMTPGGSLKADLATAGAKMFEGRDGRQVVSFAGTQTAADVMTDIRQGTGWSSEKYAAAIRVGRALKGTTTDFTGHSLGGGLAQIAGAVASEGAAPKTVVTFNPAGLHAETYKSAGIDPSAVKSQQFNVTHGTDPLQDVNRMLGMRGVGTTTALGEPGARAVDRILGSNDHADDPAFDIAHKAIRMARESYHAHGIGTVSSEIRKLMPDDRSIFADARSSAPSRGLEHDVRGR